MTSASPTPPSAPKEVACPTCGGPSLYGPENPYRPFCSKRCRHIDLGAWANEEFRVREANPSDEAGVQDDQGP